MAKSSKSALRKKPAKPYDGFPLTAHPSGRWCKKHRGKQYYFGPLDNWQFALERFQREWPYIIDDRTPPPVDAGDYCAMRDLCNSFLTSKRSKLDAGELSAGTFHGYYQTCRQLVDQFGKDRRVDDLRPDDFQRYRSKLAKRLGSVSLKNEINRVRIVLKYAIDTRLIDRPVHFGQAFDKPSAKMLRKARNEAGPRMFEAQEIRIILDSADVWLRAMTLLGINAGFGNTDVASLPQSAVDLDTGWINFPRPKTEINRRVPLWSETIEALKAAIECRPNPKDECDDDCCFITIQGNRWTRTKPGIQDSARFSKVDTVGSRFGSLLKSLDINGRRGFYGLRHTFETIGGESRDQVAVNAIMGHVDNTMAGVYRERISDERLRAVTDCVRNWLFGQG